VQATKTVSLLETYIAKELSRR